MPKVSVIIPAYNSAKYIQDTINSVLEQTHKDIEIILIDDGSSDSIKDMFPLFSERGVVCLSQPRSGASAARNRGLELASGDYIQFLDADDLIHPEKLKIQLETMIQEKVALSFTLWSSFTATLDTKRRPFYQHDYKQMRSGVEMLASFGNDGWFIPIHSWLTRRDLVYKAGFWNPCISVNDDGEYFSRVLIHCERLICIDQDFAYYRHENPNNLSQLNTACKLQSAHNSWRLIHALVLACSNDKMLVYPQRAYYILFWASYERNKMWAKVFAREFDKLNQVNRYPHIRQFPLFSLLIDKLGLYAGIRVYRSISKIRSVTRKPPNTGGN